MPHLSGEQISKIVYRIDTKSEDIIYWDDFLRFLEHEGEMREMINDMRINQQGVTILVESGRYKITREIRGSLMSQEALLGLGQNHKENNGNLNSGDH